MSAVKVTFAFKNFTAPKKNTRRDTYHSSPGIKQQLSLAKLKTRR
jgi:hypothetical protein